MFEKIKEGLGNLLTLMSAEGDPEKEETKTDEPVVEEEEKKEVEEMATDAPVEDAPAEPTEPNELETALATIEELEKKNADLEAELATFKNDATLMSAQLEEVQTAFQNYKAVKMSSQKLGDQPKETKTKAYAEMTNAEKVKFNRNK